MICYYQPNLSKKMIHNLNLSFPASSSVLQIQLLSFLVYSQHLDLIKLHQRRQRRYTFVVLPLFCCCSALHSCKCLWGCEFCFCIEVWDFRGQALILLFEWDVNLCYTDLTQEMTSFLSITRQVLKFVSSSSFLSWVSLCFFPVYRRFIFQIFTYMCWNFIWIFFTRLVNLWSLQIQGFNPSLKCWYIARSRIIWWCKTSKITFTTFHLLTFWYLFLFHSRIYFTLWYFTLTLIFSSFSLLLYLISHALKQLINRL